MLTISAYAKINLALDVLGRRSDGYHEVVMIMQAITLADAVTLTEQQRDITVTCDRSDLACDHTNLAYRAAALIRDTFRIDRGVHIHLTKRIPLAAGLAGGSADAAAVLRGLNRLWGLGLNSHELERLGAALGSDVPFCLHGGTMLATGRGEILTPLPPLPQCFVVLAKPAVSVSTAWVYGNFRPQAVGRRPDIAAMRRSLAQSDLAAVAAGLGNVLESVTIPAYPDIDRLKRLMVEAGALGSLMSGSGPTVFGLAAGREQAEHIAAMLRQQTAAEIFVAETLMKVEE